MASRRAHAWVVSLLIVPLAAMSLWLWTRSRSSAERTPIYGVALFAMLYAFIIKYIAHPFYFSPLRTLPTPDGDWFALAHGPNLAQIPMWETALRWMKEVPNPGLIRVDTFFYLNSTFFVTSPEIMAEILVHKPYEFAKPVPSIDFLRRLIGDGLVVLEGKEHKAIRKMVWPSFQGHHIRGLVPLFWRKARDLTSFVAQELQGAQHGSSKSPTNVIEISELVSHATLDIIGVAGLGHDFDTLHNSGDELASEYAMLTDPTNKKFVANFIAHEIFPTSIAQSLPFIDNPRLNKSSAKLREICMRIVTEKRATLAEKSVDEPDTILTNLFRTEGLSDEVIMNQLLTFLAAGHETTAAAFQWTMYMLAVHKDMQQRLRKEVQEVMGKARPEDALADTIDSMEYLNAIYLEVLRFWATVHHTGRIAAQDTTLGGMPIPKGTPLEIVPAAFNRLPQLWGPDAEEFVPDRWIRTDGNIYGGSNSPYCMITFLHGPRSCIGQSFAKYELKCLTVAWMLRFEFEMADPNEVVVPGGLVSSKPTNGVRLRVKDLLAGGDE